MGGGYNEINSELDGKVDVAQGAENAGKALVIGSDGNVAPGEISGGMSLYTGKLTDLISTNNNNNTLTVLKNFIIEYIIVNNVSVYISSAYVMKSNGSFYITPQPYLGITNTMYYNNIWQISPCYIYYDLNPKIITNGSIYNASQLTSETLPTVTSSSVAYYYRIYV